MAFKSIRASTPPAIHYKELVSEAKVPSVPKPPHNFYPSALRVAGVESPTRPRQERIQNLEPQSGFRK